jgi:hypothetical protein
MMKKPQPGMTTEGMPDAIWGYKNIGAEIGLSASQVRYLVVKTNVLDHAVRKLSHKVIVGSRRCLRDFAVPPG